METTTLLILLAAALVVLAVLVGVLVLRLFHKNDELREKNDVIVREIRRNQLLIDRAVQHGVSRAAMLSMAAILTICGASVLTSCSNEDNSAVTPSGPGEPAGETMKGLWYAAYDAKGTTDIELVDKLQEGTTVEYTHVMDVYQFVEVDHQGVGTLVRYFFNDSQRDPIGSYVAHLGDLSAVKADGNTLTATGVDGRQIVLTLLSEGQSTHLETLWRGSDSGSNANYDIRDFKPQGVDNSQWMKPLSDERLVCDLSIPGTHDACTAEGWMWNSLLGEPTAQTQNLTVSEQLKIGVRAFDMRPEYVLGPDGYELRCSHGTLQTNMTVGRFFDVLKAFLDANPSEFIIIKNHITATAQTQTADWSRMYASLLRSPELAGYLSDFKPRITVGEMRGKILMLTLSKYGDTPVGAFVENYSNSKFFDDQRQAVIKGKDSSAPLWAQDYYNPGSDREGKDNAILRLLDEAMNRDMTAEAPAWVFNFTAGYVGLASSDHYRENASVTNKLMSDYIKPQDKKGATGIIFMDYAGMDKTVSTDGNRLYDTNGLGLIQTLIGQNFK